MITSLRLVAVIRRKMNILLGNKFFTCSNQQAPSKFNHFNFVTTGGLVNVRLAT